MVEVTVSDDDQLDVLGIEPKRANISQHLAGVRPVKRVDQHVAIRRGDQPGRDPTDADIVDVVESLVGLDLMSWPVPKILDEVWRHAAGLAEHGERSHERSRLAFRRQRLLLRRRLGRKQSQRRDGISETRLHGRFPPDRWNSPDSEPSCAVTGIDLITSDVPRKQAS